MAHQTNSPSLIAFNHWHVSVMSIRADSVEWFYRQTDRERERERERELVLPVHEKADAPGKTDCGHKYF